MVLTGRCLRRVRSHPSTWGIAGCGALALLSVTAATAPSIAAAEEVLQNWFNDPFFQITNDIADCPLPAGPFSDERSRQVQAHRRAEKGTTCWLAKECDRPNAYAYDQDIAAAFKAAMKERKPFPETSLWVTVQGRVVYVEGCVSGPRIVAGLEEFARSVPYVQQAIAIVQTDVHQTPPYALRQRRR